MFNYDKESDFKMKIHANCANGICVFITFVTLLQGHAKGTSQRNSILEDFDSNEWLKLWNAKLKGCKIADLTVLLLRLINKGRSGFRYRTCQVWPFTTSLVLGIVLED